MASQSEPLISGPDVDPGADSDHDTGPSVSKSPDAAPGLFVWLLTLSAGVSGLLFGCTIASLLQVLLLR